MPLSLSINVEHIVCPIEAMNGPTPEEYLSFREKGAR
jgi:hypothetical protein